MLILRRKQIYYINERVVYLLFLKSETVWSSGRKLMTILVTKLGIVLKFCSKFYVFFPTAELVDMVIGVQGCITGRQSVRPFCCIICI